MRPVCVWLAIALTAATAAATTVPESVRVLPWRRAVERPDAGPGAWTVVELDSTVARATGGEISAVRLVDDSGSPVPVAVLEPRWPEVIAVALADSLAWRREEDDGVRYLADVDLPPGRFLRARWPEGVVVHAYAPDGPVNWRPIAPMTPRDWPEPQGATWQTSDPRVRLVASGMPSAPPAIALERLTVRESRLRAVPFTVVSGDFRQTTYTVVIALPSGPHAVAGVTLARRPDTRLAPVVLDVRRPDGGWRRVVTTSREDDERIEVDGKLALATHLRLSYGRSEPPIAPFEVREVTAVPPALAVGPDVAGDLWLVYGEHPAPAPPSLPPDTLATVAELAPARLGPVEPSPWFAETPLGATWLRRRPVVVTGVMILVLAAVAAIIVGDRRQ